MVKACDLFQEACTSCKISDNCSAFNLKEETSAGKDVVTSIFLIAFTGLAVSLDSLWAESRMLRKIHAAKKLETYRKSLPGCEASTQGHILSALDKPFPLPYFELAGGSSPRFARLYPVMFFLTFLMLNAVTIASSVLENPGFADIAYSPILAAFRIRVYVGAFEVLGAFNGCIRVVATCLCAIVGIGYIALVVWFGMVISPLPEEVRKGLDYVDLAVHCYLTVAVTVFGIIPLLANATSDLICIVTCISQSRVPRNGQELPQATDPRARRLSHLNERQRPDTTKF